MKRKVTLITGITVKMEVILSYFNKGYEVHGIKEDQVISIQTE